MSSPKPNPHAQDGDTSRFEETLRLIANLPAPAGLEERIQTGLRTQRMKGRILPWSSGSRVQSPWLRAAAAAAIVCVVVAGGWKISSRAQFGQVAKGTAPLPGSAASGGFSSAGAIRTPHTLHGPLAEPAVAEPAAAVQAVPVQDEKAPADAQKAKTPVKKPAVQTAK